MNKIKKELPSGGSFFGVRAPFVERYYPAYVTI